MAGGGVVSFVCVAVMIGAWVAMSELIKDLDVNPWLICWTIRVSFSLAVVPWLLIRWRRKRILATSRVALSPDLPVSERRILAGSTGLAVLGNLCAFTWYLSLHGTSVPGNAAVYQSASCFVFIASVLLLGEKATVEKVTAVVLSTIGVFTICFAPSPASGDGQSVDTIGGYAWLMVSVVGYALYEVLYAVVVGMSHDEKKKSDAEVHRLSTLTAPVVLAEATTATPLMAHTDTERNNKNMAPEEEADECMSATAQHYHQLQNAEMAAMVLMLVGLVTLVLLWPVFYIFDITGVELFRLPTAHGAKLLLLNCGLDFFYNLALLLGIVFSSPLVVSLGTMLVVPVSALVDWMVRGTVMGLQASLGGLLVLCGFAVLQLKSGTFARLLCRGKAH